MVRSLIFIISLFLSGGMFAQKTAYEKIDSLIKAVNDLPDTAKQQKVIGLNDLATAYMHTSNFVQAARFYAESLDLATQMKDELLMALVYRNMAVLSSNQSDTAMMKAYHQKALAIYEKRNDKTRKAHLLKMMADILLTSGDTMNARRNYEDAIAAFRQTRDRLAEAMAYANFSITYNTQYPEKIRLAVEAKKIFDSLNTDNPVPAANIGNLGVAYFDIVRYNHMHLAPPGPLIPATKQELLMLAEKYFREAISTAQSHQDIANAAYFSGLLAELQEYNGDYKNAYYNIRKYYDTNDSLYSQENKNKIAALQSKQEIDLKSAEIEKRILQLRNQRTQLFLLLAGVGLLFIIGLLLYRQSSIRKKNNRSLQQLNSQLASANEVKAKFFAILSHDLRSPVARLVSFLQFRKLEPDGLSAHEVAVHERKMEEAAQSLLSTIEGLLLWSKQQMEFFRPVKTDVSVQSLFDYIKSNFAGNESVHFDFLLPENISIHTDENYLRTILYNLTSNAVKATLQVPSPHIEWKAWKNDHSTFLSITDNGPGLSTSQAINFFEGGNGTDSQHGFGLYIIRDLARAIQCKPSLGQVEKGMQVLLQFHATTTKV